MAQADRKLVRALEDARDRELRAVALYRLLAERETDERRKRLFGRLADEELEHSKRFVERLEALGVTAAPPEIGPRPLDRVVVRWLGSEAMLRRMEAEEASNLTAFGRAADAIEADPATRDLFRDVERDEKNHARLLQASEAQGAPAARLEAILKGEKWHVSTGSWIGDAIYGVNDGLGAVFGFVSGTAAYTAGDTRPVIFAGLLGTMASALSMGSSAFLASKSEREVHQAEIERERREIEESPEHEIEELALLLQLKGFEEDESRVMAATIAKRPDQFLRTMAQEELGLSDQHLPNPGVSLLSATVATAIGGIIPVLPFFFAGGVRAIIASAVVSTLAHFAVGAAKSLVTARVWWKSGLEMTIVGVLMGAVTYVLGVVFKLG